MDEQLVEYWRPPTLAEITFGNGAPHYIFFPIGKVRKADGTLKKWTVGPDGLRYYRY